MSLFGNQASGHARDYPPLNLFSWAGYRVAEVERELQQLVQTVCGPLEVVPTDHAAYVFSGNPPKKFGVAWICDRQIRGFYRLVEECGVTPVQIADALDALRDAYAKNHNAERYTATIAQRSVVVTVSESLQKDVHSIIDEMQH